MGIISVENTNRLYWLGRYSERVYTTLRLFARYFDQLIDQDQNIYSSFCRAIEIPDIYTSGEDFIDHYVFDPEDVNSIYSNLIRAYDNGIVLREAIGSEALSYIQMAIYDMEKARGNQAPVLELQKVIDNLLAFWGIADDSIDDEKIRGIIKVGKRVERLDLYARTRGSRDELSRCIARLGARLSKSGLFYDRANMADLTALVNSPIIDYDKMIRLTENLLDV